MKSLKNLMMIGVIITASAVAALCQTEKQLAQQYYGNDDCHKAVSYYVKLLPEAFDKIELRNYCNCIVKLTLWSEGEKFIKKQIKADDINSGWYYLYWGIMLEAQGKNQESVKRYQQAITALGQQVDQKREMAEQFRSMNKPEMALTALLDARQTAKRDDLYTLELAGVYRDLNQPDSMIEQLLSYGLRYNDTDVVEHMLRNFRKDEKDDILLEKVLYEKIQKFPEEPYYTKLLIWHQIQRKDFNKAFIQEKALDKRLKLEGDRLYNLGMLSLQNLDYETSGRIFEYIIKAYPLGSLYPISRRMVIFSREQQVRNTYPINKSAVYQLLREYEKLIADIGKNTRTMEALRNMANLYAFYLNDFNQASDMLQTAIEVGRQDTKFTNQCKLDLGDIFVLKGESWEATLLYSQVEKSEKDDILGYEAKLRNAKLHYYQGEFDLARDVLNILKKATTREIANDANDLSLLIMDNTGLDSNESAMKSYSAVELLLFQNKRLEALDSLRLLYKRYENHSLSDEILWLTAQTYMKLDSNQQALSTLELLSEKFGVDILGDDALFETARLFEEKLNNKAKAMALYQQLLEKYPGSIYIAESRKRFRNLRGDIIN